MTIAYRLVYKGDRRIIAIKAVRRHTGHGLKDCLVFLRNPNGFIVDAKTAEKIIMCYMNDGIWDFISRLTAWEVTIHSNMTPDDLRVPTVEEEARG